MSEMSEFAVDFQNNAHFFPQDSELRHLQLKTSHHGFGNAKSVAPTVASRSESE